MSRMSLATPCPAPTARPHQDALSVALANGDFGDETWTSNIDYTRAIQQEFSNARPRRRTDIQRKAARNAPVTIFEDVIEGQELVVDQTKMVPGRTLLGRPAKKMHPHATVKTDEVKDVQPLGEIAQARRRAVVATNAVQTTARSPRLVQHTETATETAKATQVGLKKDPRRRTIFVPPDDTTCLTIHPGANTTNRLDDTFQPPYIAARAMAVSPAPRTAVMLEQRKPTRTPRTSLGVAPKRLPLQATAVKQSNLPSVDFPGQNGGKENMPPAMDFDLTDEKPSKPAVVEIQSPKTSVVRSRLHAPTAASQARQSVVSRNAVPLARSYARPLVTKAVPSQRSPPAQSRASPRPWRTRAVPSVQPISTFEDAVKPVKRASPPIKRATPPKRVFSRPSKLSQYPILPEDVSQPQLYEERWLSHQEIALTELINEVLHTAQPTPQSWHAHETSLRERMLKIYHQPNVTTLHKRMQASLLYGALSRPKDMSSPPDPALDIGLRKRFLNLWLHTYDEEALRTAAEVVVGRQVPRKASIGANDDMAASESVLDPAKGRRALIGFLETFFINVEDADSFDDEPHGAEGHRWRKRILRSLMLIWLLDRAKQSTAVVGSLFKHSASIKSSAVVLHALSGLLIPSIGDITRVLRHFDYEVNHRQDLLDEVVYRVENIAVDLRDGIFLCRLVETLLFTSRQKESEHDQTITVTMPDMTTLQSALYVNGGGPCPRILSQHLKMPCLGRAQKTYNAQIALSALQDQATLGDNVFPNITADEIVDGHREKTLSLLWTLVSNHGLAQLIDWNELAADLRRSGAHVPYPEQATQTQHEELLQAWAAAHSLRRGIAVTNLTTSFADGQAYTAILAAFSPFLPPPTSTPVEASAPAKTPLARALHSLGCSTAFSSQLTSSTSTSTIPSRTTTLSNLAFLASRLLPLARRHHAAALIQQTFRRRLARKVLTRRITLARLATVCATVVRARNRRVDAVTVLQRAWRRVVDVRIARLNGDVAGFQVWARGWAVRRLARGAVTGAKGGKSPRVMGGW
ncbi:hypothetical protein LTR08_000989 [Meristemomyces frigidus]|nr:hypothetical protein LTR08_000989 [Meristemomyces frigidus]